MVYSKYSYSKREEWGYSKGKIRPKQNQNAKQVKHQILKLHVRLLKLMKLCGLQGPSVGLPDTPAQLTAAHGAMLSGWLYLLSLAFFGRHPMVLVSTTP